ncbi:cysteine synthase A [Sulfobacillus thermosulfidooxidans]|uniref:Cysteine synthase n=2 Tax=Sulfobacillus thermosulfidooxidans TaxID=28034 RepID=A0A1W1WJR1_SULTA|nr:cysteine synthase A [Sulfobacillus thermosulfidooxidans]OLZ10735.1 cysteine synthase A [Sulfobacillus thermosulfidooxidans]OLZ13226.1 cysteine synthase A [Sulfobacillus thermosulfidooxidans]OLZ21606.1 cysteine synthase A [Sulfobacillus thermosulfidooxidans]PSR24430.1 MAG: cysteine synthase A [Sulfobacillus thermosulfidooxidans]SMC06003.1 cysteine synthase A [Sulfobacillus thermosulfidooxidans DSM 9293]
MRTFESVCDLIGRTPLVKLQKISELRKCLIYGKLESYNPGGSVKDRIALNMVAHAEKEGILRPGGVIIEPTSGNTGVGLAMVAAKRGYRCILTMPDTASIERRLLFQAFGAEVELTPGKFGMVGAISRAAELEKEIPGAMSLHQFENPANPEIHRLTTGPEIWEDTEGMVTAVVAGIGTGGTITGIAQYLKERNPAIDIIGVEPAESPVISGGNPGPHKIQGIGAGFVPKTLDVSLLDYVIPISSEEAFHTARDLARSEGLLVGISSGAAIAAANQWLMQEHREHATIVVILPDSGERYLSTALYQEEG